MFLGLCAAIHRELKLAGVRGSLLAEHQQVKTSDRLPSLIGHVLANMCFFGFLFFKID